MKNKYPAAFFAAFKTMTPIVPGIVPTGAAYAIFAASTGIKTSNIILSSLVVFAGSVQFITIELVKQNIGYLQFVLIIFLLHSRHLFFGISLFDKINKTGKAKPLMIYGVTDETYAVMTSGSPPQYVDEGLYYIFITAIMYTSWNIGTALGAFVSGFITFNTEGMDFALSAMFLVIMLEQFKSYKSKLPFVVGGVSAAASLVILGSQSMLLGCCAVSAATLLIARKYVEGDGTEA